MLQEHKKQAFVYCWTDWATNKLYVGVHKGQPDDGYVCSSKYVLEAYNKRPQDFTRQIIASGNAFDMCNFEKCILKAANAAADPDFYNLHNGNGDFTTLGVSPTEAQRKKVSVRMKGENHPLFGVPWTQERREKTIKSLTGLKRSENIKNKLSVKMTGSGNHMFGVASPHKGKHNSPEQIAKFRQSQKLSFCKKHPWIKEKEFLLHQRNVLKLSWDVLAEKYGINRKTMFKVFSGYYWD